VPSTLKSSRLQSVVLLLTAVAALTRGIAAQATSGSAVEHTTLHSFGGPDGAGPLYGVIADKRGLFTAQLSAEAEGGLQFSRRNPPRPAQQTYIPSDLYLRASPEKPAPVTSFRLRCSHASTQ